MMMMCVFCFVYLGIVLEMRGSSNDANRDVIGIFEIPGALPIAGHLLELGDDHATVCEVC